MAEPLYVYRIVQKDRREYVLTTDLIARKLIAQEKDRLKELYLKKEGAEDSWELVFPSKYY